MARGCEIGNLKTFFPPQIQFLPMENRELGTLDLIMNVMDAQEGGWIVLQK